MSDRALGADETRSTNGPGRVGRPVPVELAMLTTRGVATPRLLEFERDEHDQHDEGKFFEVVGIDEHAPEAS